MASIAVNNFITAIGHVDFTLTSDSGEKHVYGLNVNSNHPTPGTLYAVQDETASVEGNFHVAPGPEVGITQDQYDAIKSMVDTDISKGDHFYSLVGYNCVDYTQEALNKGGVPYYVADFLSDHSSSAAKYAITERALFQHSPGLAFDVGEAGDVVSGVAYIGGKAADLALRLYQGAIKFWYDLDGDHTRYLDGPDIIITVDPTTHKGYLTEIPPLDPTAPNTVQLDIPNSIDLNATGVGPGFVSGLGTIQNGAFVTDRGLDSGDIDNTYLDELFANYANSVLNGQGYTPDNVPYDEPRGAAVTGVAGHGMHG